MHGDEGERFVEVHEQRPAGRRYTPGGCHPDRGRQQLPRTRVRENSRHHGLLVRDVTHRGTGLARGNAPDCCRSDECSARRSPAATADRGWPSDLEVGQGEDERETVEAYSCRSPRTVGDSTPRQEFRPAPIPLTGKLPESSSQYGVPRAIGFGRRYRRTSNSPGADGRVMAVSGPTAVSYRRIVSMLRGPSATASRLSAPPRPDAHTPRTGVSQVVSQRESGGQ